MKKTFRITCLVLAIVIAGLLFWAPSQYVVPVLMYHSVSLRAEEPLNTVSLGSFTRQMDFLKKYGYKVISLSDLVEGIKSGKRFAFQTAVITFDDGFADNYTAAYPILKARAFPATIFIPSDEIGSKSHLTWPQVQEMAANGIIIGSHMRTEAYAPSNDHQQMIDEIAGSKAIIEKKLRRPVDFIAFPIGGFTEEAQKVVRDAGYKAAFTTNRGKDKKNKDLFELKRIRIKDSDGSLVLVAKLSGFYNFFRSRKSSY